jgi:hypothetical protein
MESDNVVQMPDRLERLAKRADTAAHAFAARHADAIANIIEYGNALLEARAEFVGDLEFGQWVAANHLDQVKPFDLQQERTAAMKIAELSAHSTMLWADCPHNRPTHIMTWWRAQENPDASPKSPKRSKTDDVLDEVIRHKAETGGYPSATRKTFEYGVNHSTIEWVTYAARKIEKAKAEIDAEALAKAALEALPKTTKEKYDIAERAMRKRLEWEFEQRVQAEATRRFDTMMKPFFESKLELYESVVASRRGLFTKAQYNLIQACLHPDHVATLGEDWIRRHNEGFRLFRAAEIKLLDNRELPLTGDNPWKFKR